MRAGTIVWLTGLPSSGKSTLAERVLEELVACGQRRVVILDGDAVRAAIRPSHGYDEAGRDAFYETLARLAALLAAQGQVVLVPATAHRTAYRERARGLAPGPFLEVFLDTDLDTCRARDAKGLYARAAQEAGTVPGADLAYEAPLAPELIVRPGDPLAARRLAGLVVSVGSSTDLPQAATPAHPPPPRDEEP